MMDYIIILPNLYAVVGSRPVFTFKIKWQPEDGVGRGLFLKIDLLPLKMGLFVSSGLEDCPPSPYILYLDSHYFSQSGRESS